MIKNCFLILSLILAFKYSECKKKNSKEKKFEDKDNEEFINFKTALKEYLEVKDLFNSDRLINPPEMKRIFFEVINEGDSDNTPVYLRKIFGDLTEYFVKKYYNENKEIRGRDIYNLFDINEITKKFEDIAIQNNPLFNNYNKEDDDLDNKDFSVDDL